MTQAPIAFFAYKRPDHTRKSLESLAQNLGAEKSELFIFCDAAKKDEDIEPVNQVRQVVRQKQWCGTVHIIEQESNLGLANSIILGVTKLCNDYGKVIVLEDDLILSPHFLDYMNTALGIYADQPQVMQISGYMFPVNLKSEQDVIFLPFTTSWGWATWQRAWQNFDAEMRGYQILKSNKKLRYQFDLYGSYSYFSMLEDQISGKTDSWAIRWYLSTFMMQALTLYPVRSLVQNIGFDGSGTHCNYSLAMNCELADVNKVLSMPKSTQLNHHDVKIVVRYLQSLRQPVSIFQRIKSKISRQLALLGQ